MGVWGGLLSLLRRGRTVIAVRQANRRTRAEHLLVLDLTDRCRQLEDSATLLLLRLEALRRERDDMVDRLAAVLPPTDDTLN